MNVLVTGGAGFIGSHLVRELLARGHAVTAVDDLSTGTLQNLPASVTSFDFVRGSILDAELMRSVSVDADAVVHLAAVASVAASVARPVETTRTNLLGTVTLLGALPERPGLRVVFAGSAAAYGAATRRCHEADVLDPLSPYAADKAAGELYVLEAARRRGQRATTLRFFNVYGERQDPSSPYSGVISVFTSRYVVRDPVEVFGDGGQSRDFVYAGDVAGVIASALEDGDAEPPRVLNVGTGRSVTLLELLDTLTAITGYVPERRFGPRRPGDVYHSEADVGALQAYLPEFQPTGLRQGLERTLAWLAEPQRLGR
jgi:UDP-glucose 4-epimerase